MRKGEGFKGQKSIVLPGFILSDIQNDPLGSQLYLTDIGYYPCARDHYRLRKNGCNQYILVYCVGGKGWFSIDGKRKTIGANQFFIIPKDIGHSYGADKNDPWSIYWIHFSGKFASHFSNIIGDSITISPSPESRIDDRIQLFEEIMLNLEMGYSKDNINYANICLWHFLASFKYVSQFRQIKSIGERDMVDRIILFMKQELKNKLTLEHLAREFSLSPSHFSMVFRKKTGRSPMDYFIHLRIQKACQLLNHSDWKIKEIASSIGFEDSFYFSRLFKKIMGVSPKIFRENPSG